MEHETRLNTRITWGAVIAAGVCMNILTNVQLWGLGISPAVWAGLFGIAGLGFAVLFLKDHRDAWAVLPALILLAVAAVLGFQVGGLDWSWTWDTLSELGAMAALFLAGGGVARVFTREQVKWWALPLSVALIALGLEFQLARWSPILGVIIYVLGLGLTIWLSVKAHAWFSSNDRTNSGSQPS